MIDYKRRPKDTYYFYQSQWTKEPMVYIVSHTWTHRRGVEGEKKAMRAFSNCDVVELFLNGMSLGVQEKDFKWNVAFREGENELLAKAKKGGVTVTDQMRVYYEISQQLGSK